MLSIGLGDQLLERILKHKVVGLKDAHVLAARHLQAAVHRVTVAAVGLVDKDDARVNVGVHFADFQADVLAAIVQQQDLNAFISLGADAFDTAGNAPGSVVHGHDDAYKGKFHRFSFSQMRLWVRANASESFCTGPLGRGLSNRLR